MKKRKFSLWLNLVALCLCFATLAIGVYSAKTAKLNTNGTISFKAHDCKVAVVGTISNAMRSESLNYAPVSDKTYTSAQTGSAEWQDKFDKGAEEDGSLKLLSAADTWIFGDIYFDDMNIGNTESVKPIIITFAITNYSPFKVKASFTTPTGLGDNIVTTDTENEKTLDKYTGTGDAPTATLTLKLAITGDNVSEIVSKKLEFDVNFEKVTA